MRGESGILVLGAEEGVWEMPRRMGILALFYLKIGLLNVKKKSSLLHVDFLIPLGLRCYLLCGLDQLWLRCVNRQTYSVLESWRIDKEGSMEISVENRGPSMPIAQRENKQSSGNTRKDKENTGRK